MFESKYAKKIQEENIKISTQKKGEHWKVREKYFVPVKSFKSISA